MNSKTAFVINHRFMLAIVLNTLFIIVELIYGYRANSVALIADAVHNAADVFGLCLIWFSYTMARRPAPRHFTYGYKNATIFAAFLNAIVIFFAVGNLVWGSISRISNPEFVLSQTMMTVASLGVVINGLTALLFLKDRHKDLNILGVFLNMSMDAAVSFGVVIAGAFIWWKGWDWLDPTMGLVIAAMIIISSWGFFKESINLIFQAVPAGINFEAINRDIESFKGVVGYHDLHIWALSTTETALSVHVKVKSSDFGPEMVQGLCDKFRDHYGIIHATVQLEIDNQTQACNQNC